MGIVNVGRMAAVALLFIAGVACHRSQPSKELAALYSAYQSGVLTKAEYEAKRAALETQSTALAALDKALEAGIFTRDEYQARKAQLMAQAGALAALVPRTRDAVARFVELVQRQEAALREGALSPRQWAENFVREIAYEAELRRGEKTPEAADNRVRNLRELLATLGTTAGNTAAQVESFLDDLALDSGREEEQEQTGDAVTLITMHSCKGLEFPHVYIVGLEDGLLPHSRSKAEGTLDEERRLFYVALTRAMRTLTLSHCAARKKYGQPLACQPSPFLRELPAELLELAGEKSQAPVSVEAGREGFAAMRLAAGGNENGQ